MKTIVIVLAVILIGCKKKDPIDKVTTTQQVTTAQQVVEPILYTFAQSINSNTNAQLFDMQGNSVGSVNNYINYCTGAYMTLDDSVDYRLVMNGMSPNGTYMILIWEGIVTSNNGVLTYLKTGGSGNMYYDNSCGYYTHVVK